MISVPVKLFVLKVLRLLTRLFILTVRTGRLNPLVSVIRMLLCVALLSPATIRFDMLVSPWNALIRSNVPRLAAVLSISRAPRGVDGLPPWTMWMTPVSLLTRLVWPRRWLVALTTSRLVFLVLVCITVLQVRSVGLDFRGVITIGMFVCRF